MLNDTFLLSAIIFLPSVGALALGIFNLRSESAMRAFANTITFLTFILSLVAWRQFDSSIEGMQMATTGVPWISSWNVNYTLGVDGISLPLVLLGAPAGALVQRKHGNFLVAEQHPSVVGLHQTNQHVESGRFASAIRPEQPYHFPRVDVYLDIIDHGAAAIDLRKMLPAEHRR